MQDTAIARTVTGDAHHIAWRHPITGTELQSLRLGTQLALGIEEGSPDQVGQEYEWVTDRVLIGAAVDGDKDAFAVIVGRYGPQLHRYARAALPDAGAADEVVQDAFVAAWKSLDVFRAQSALRTWLYSILSHKINDHRRRRSITPSEDWLLDRRSADAATDPHTAVSNKDFMIDLSIALAELPYRQRACWLLREVDGLPFAEIGTIMALTAGGARGHAARANATLAERLATWR